MSSAARTLSIPPVAAALPARRVLDQAPRLGGAAMVSLCGHALVLVLAIGLARPIATATITSEPLHEIEVLESPVSSPQSPAAPAEPPPPAPLAHAPVSREPPAQPSPPEDRRPKTEDSPTDPYADLAPPAAAGPLLTAGEGTGSDAVVVSPTGRGHGRVSAHGHGDGHGGRGSAPAALAPPRPTIDVQPRELSCPRPAYPLAAKRRGLEGTVRVKLQVDARGEVASAKLAGVDGDSSFGEAVMGAVGRCRFAPAQSQGRPVTTWVTKVVSFHAPRR